MAQAIREMIDQMSEMSKGSDKILQTIQGFQKLNAAVQNSADQINAVTDNLNKHVGDLSRISQHSMDDISQMTSEIDD